MTLDLRDVTGDVSAEHIANPIADVVFCRGQTARKGTVVNDLESTFQTIRSGWEHWPRWALLLLDLHFKTGRVDADGEPEGHGDDRDPSQFFGLTILEQLWKDSSLKDIPVVILSAMKEHRDTIEHRFASHGAWDFIDKTDLEQKVDSLKTLLDRYGLLEDSRIIGRSIPMLKALREARARARHGNDNVLVLGESGTGKELLASYIHRQSRRVGDYVALFTEGVPETLVDDRLCGHEKGAFTGAKEQMCGAAELADRGTLFIDEFGNIPASIQQKLLRLLDKNTREIQRLGSIEVRKLDLQVVMATNRLDILSSNDFRHDLLFRAKVHDAIILPPLRERPEDIPLLAEYFVKKFENEFTAKARTISAEALERLKSHSWPDNIRGLERVIETAIYKWRGLKIIAANHLSLAPPSRGDVPSQIGTPVRRTAPEDGGQGVVDKMAAENPSLDDVLQKLSSVDFDETTSAELACMLPKLQSAYACVLAQYLKAALIATRRPTPQNPEGDILIHPAVKLITGDQTLSASKAADLVKKMLGVHPEIAEEWLRDPVLSKAYATALRLRPKRSKTNER